MGTVPGIMSWAVNNICLFRTCALYVALEYPQEDFNGLCVYRPAKEGRLCEYFVGYKIISNRIHYTFNNYDIASQRANITIIQSMLGL